MTIFTKESLGYIDMRRKSNHDQNVPHALSCVGLQRNNHVYLKDNKSMSYFTSGASGLTGGDNRVFSSIQIIC